MEGINMDAGIANVGSEDLLYSIFGDFYLMIDEKIEKIQKCISEDRLRDYTVEVHAVKSAARIIGAVELGEEFYQLELIGRDENRNLIEEKTPAVLEHLRSYKQILEKYAPKTEDDKKDMNTTDVVALLRDMVIAIDSFDLDKADMIVEKLDDYKFPENYQEELELLKGYVANLAMDEAVAICKSIEAGLLTM